LIGIEFVLVGQERGTECLVTDVERVLDVECVLRWQARILGAEPPVFGIAGRLALNSKLKRAAGMSHHHTHICHIIMRLALNSKLKRAAGRCALNDAY